MLFTTKQHLSGPVPEQKVQMQTKTDSPFTKKQQIVLFKGRFLDLTYISLVTYFYVNLKVH